MKPAEVNPNPTPKWVKETLVEDYAEQIRVGGGDPSIPELDAIVQEDLRRYHAEEREGLHRNLVTPKKRRGEMEPAAKLAKDMGGSLHRGTDIRRKRACELLPPREKLLHARIRHLMTVLPGGSFLGRDFLYPKWGNALAKAHLDFTKRRERYAGLRRPDAEKALARQLEDIADQSAFTLGAWH